MNGFLDIHGARAFLGNKSLSWLRQHIREIPHMKLYGQLLFSPEELTAWVLRVAERDAPVDVDAVVRSVLHPLDRKRRATR